MTSESNYAAPKSKLIKSETALSRKGRYAIAHPELEWPNRCFKCNEETGLHKETKLSYVNPLVYLSILVTILLTIILVLIYRKKFKINMPMCEKHLKRRKSFQLFQWSVVSVLMLSIALAFLTESEAYIFVALAAFTVLFVSALFGRMAFAAKYKDDKLWIQGAGKKFLNSLPEYAT